MKTETKEFQADMTLDAANQLAANLVQSPNCQKAVPLQQEDGSWSVFTTTIVPEPVNKIGNWKSLEPGIIYRDYGLNVSGLRVTALINSDGGKVFEGENGLETLGWFDEASAKDLTWRQMTARITKIAKTALNR